MKTMKGFGSVLTIWGLSLLILAMFFVMFQVKAEGISFYILVLVILVALAVIDIHAWKIFRTIHAKNAEAPQHPQHEKIEENIEQK